MVQGSILCSHCHGQRWDCPVCEGNGEEEIFVCPNRAHKKPGVSECLTYCSMAMDGHWPSGGGVLEQSATFLEAFHEYRRFYADKMEREQEK